MSGILALDPGTTKTGYCWLDEGRVAECGVAPNHGMLDSIRFDVHGASVLAIEMVASYGMAVGKEVFETVRWIGRFQQAWDFPEAVMLIYRQDVKLHLCNSVRAKDANIRQALLDRFPATGGGKTPQVGTKSQPGPLYGISSHAWAALGVAITAKHQMENQ